MTLNDLVLEGAQPVWRFATLGDMLANSARRFPQCIALKERCGTGWNSLTYEQIHEGARSLAVALTGLGLSKERPLAIVSDNSMDHALLALGAMLAGVPVAPISVAYSRFSDLSRLKGIIDILTPGLVYVADGQSFAKALALADERGIPVLVSANPRPGMADRLLRDLPTNPHASPSVKLSGDTIAKISFTSGSTGSPKGVIVTHRMMCSNQDALAQMWPFLDNEPPVIVDWLPWSHIFGGTLVFNCALRNAGTFVIDEGRPVAGRFAATVQNIREVRPTVHFGVPRGFGELVVALEQDQGFAEAYFSRLRAIFTAGAALPADLWDRLHSLAARYGAPDLGIHVSWGATETAPVVTISPEDNDRADNIGIPVPGARIKFAPDQDKHELRVKGPMVTPGYWRSPDATANAFDKDGYYRMGDAGRLADEQDPSRGILFDGRTSENFKLATGTWVRVGPLRLALLEMCSPLVQDAAITGHDRDEIGALLFLNEAACREMIGMPSASLAALAQNPVIRNRIAECIVQGGLGGASSTRVGRAMLMATPPSLEAGEVTDKGYLNQRGVLRARADLVEQLYAERPGQDVISTKQQLSLITTERHS